MTPNDALTVITLVGLMLFGIYAAIVTYRDKPRYPLWWSWLIIALLSLLGLIAPWLSPLD